MKRLAISISIALAALTAGACLAQETVVKRSKGQHWVGTWAASAQEVEKKLLPPGHEELADTTVRQVVRVTIGGGEVRVRFSNAFAAWNDDLEITSACIAVSTGGSTITLGPNKPLTFHGKTSVLIPPGTLMISDPVPFNLAPGSDLAVTFYVAKAPKKVTGHRGARNTMTQIQPGNAVAEEGLATAVKSGCWYYLCGVDVLAPDASAAVVCLGDSITDGKGSTENANRRWPDYLARCLRKNEKTANVGVLNQGIGGNCLWRGGIGQTALQRLERDVLTQPGTRWLMILEGINDLSGGKTSAEELIVAYEQIILRAHERGLRVYGATILPFGGAGFFTAELETKRQKVNAWIKNSGAFDAVIDWDAATRDPNVPTQLRAEADCGDHLHASDDGYRIMAEAVDLDLFTK